MVGGRDGDRNKQLLQTQELLGPQPPELKELLPEASQVAVTVGTEDSLFKEIKGMRECMEDAREDSALVNPFSEEFLCLVADLLKRMLAYDVNDRCSAKEALDHEFFKARK